MRGRGVSRIVCVVLIGAMIFSGTFVGMASVPNDGAKAVPTIVSTNPADGATGVSVTANYVVTWSEAVNIGMTNIAPLPAVMGSWTTSNSITWTYSGPTWLGVTFYTLTFSGWTSVSTGEPCTPAIKTFTTNDGVAPYIVTMTPADGTIGASTTGTISAQWSEAMNPLYGSISFSPMIFTGSSMWTAGNSIFTFSGAVFSPSTTYTATFVGFRDASGTPANGDLIKMFTTNDGVAPTITTIVPADGATGVASTANVVVTWSEPMNSSAGTVNISPAPLVAGTWAWSVGNTVRTYSGATWGFNTYTLTFSSFKDVSGMSAGGDLVKAFTVLGPPPVSISTIVPADGATGVSQTASVVVTWDEAMNPAVGTVNIVPAPLVAGTWAWSVGNSVYSYTGATWSGYTLHTLTFNNFMSAAGGTASGDLVKTFTTTAVPPVIATITPADGAVAVLQTTNAVVTWDKAMNPAVGTVSIVPAPTVAGTWAWSAGNTVYTYSGMTWSFGLITLTFTGFMDTMGNSAIGDLTKVFTTQLPPAPLKAQGVNVAKSGTNNILISWTNPSASDFWDIYAGTVKSTVKQPGNLLGTVTMGTGTFTHVNGQNTGTTLYYLVIGRNSGGTESGYSTMGVKEHIAFAHNSLPKTNIMWITIPQDSGYTTASDIVMELEGGLIGPGLDSKINGVGKWIPASQYSTAFIYDSDFEEWTGDDFLINPGDGIYFSVTSSFNWAVCGIDVNPVLSFTHNALPKTNIMWFNLPSSCTYTTASQIVLELEGALMGPGLDAKINVIGQWVPISQCSTAYVYDSDFEEWTGDDFTITPGTGIYFSVTSSFTWTPALITPVVP